MINFLSAQNIQNSLVLDGASLNPIEFVDVYNAENYTTTNEDGEFVFTSENDSIKLRRLGYYELNTTFEKLKEKDTVFLIKRINELNEVVVTNEKPVLDRMYGNIIKNSSSESFKEKFYLRTILKKEYKI